MDKLTGATKEELEEQIRHAQNIRSKAAHTVIRCDEIIAILGAELKTRRQPNRADPNYEKA